METKGEKIDASSELHATVVKKDCPHILDDDFTLPTKETLKKLLDGSDLSCNNCSEIKENWICLHCSGMFCGRFKNQHGLKHHKETGHNAFLGTNDLSFWCYQCDRYILSKELENLAKYLHEEKFGTFPEEYETGETNAKEINVKEEEETKNKDSGEHIPSTTTGSPDGTMPSNTPLSLDHQVPFTSKELKKWKQSIQQIATLIKSNQHKNVIVLTGAGISTAAGIPDFRSPGTGLYDNLQKYNLPHPTAVFELDYFEQNPKPFFEITKDFVTKGYKPTYCHHFIKLLEDKGILLRNFTQNIDGLELKAGVTPMLLCQAHGTYTTSTCMNCRMKYDFSFLKKFMDETELDIPRCNVCKGVVKPDIVFFGESLPKRFLSLATKDFAQCDLLIVMGTSLTVYPVAGLVGLVKPKTPRVLINREPAGPFFKLAYQNKDQNRSDDDDDDDDDDFKDFFIGGSIENSVRELAKELGWDKELEKMYKSGGINLA